MKKKTFSLVLLMLALLFTAIAIRQDDNAMHGSASKENLTAGKLDMTQNEATLAPVRPTQNHSEPSAEAKLLKIDDNGTRIYQVDDTQVSVSKDGELFFLPSKI